MRLFLATLILLLPLRLEAAELHWIVVSNYDGDSLRAAVSPNSPSFPVRIMGLDTPEIMGRCEAESRMARVARDRLRVLLASGVVTFEPSAAHDKYRRVLAVVRVNGVDVAQVMIGAGLARQYQGERRAGWCQ